MQSNDFKNSAIATSLLVLIFIVFWELFWRGKGYVISYNEDKVMWANARKKVYKPADQMTVFIGDSRVKFDIDLPTWKSLTGEDAVQLALVGTSPRPILNNLANDEQFRGNVIMGASEIALYAMDSMQREISARDGIEYYKNETPAQKLNVGLDFMLESKLVFLEEGKFGLNALLNTLPITNRPGVIPRLGPPKAFAYNTIDRQAHISSIFFNDTSVKNAVIRYWTAGATRNKQKIITGDTLELYFKQLKTSIDKIKSRGGKVCIIRPPSSGTFLAREKKLYPRNQYFDRLVQYTGLTGFYFTDHPEIANLVCPEESHLTPADAIIYTKSLVNFLKKNGWTFNGSSDSLTSQIKQ
jgi:hypothetical protein